MCDIALIGNVKFCEECKINLLSFVKREKERNVQQRKKGKNPRHKSIGDRTDNLAQYGLTPTDYKRMLVEQNNKCAICLASSKGKHLSVDHNHNSGQVRGLLCNNCNAGIGFLQDDHWVVSRAAEYLKKHARKILRAVGQDGSCENQ